jgi:hypothetical protein
MGVSPDLGVLGLKAQAVGGCARLPPAKGIAARSPERVRGSVHARAEPVPVSVPLAGTRSAVCGLLFSLTSTKGKRKKSEPVSS